VAAQAPFAHKLAVLVAMSTIMTLGIYGLVAALVRLDDFGLALARSPALRASLAAYAGARGSRAGVL
jgi:predicted DNA repair protein MutK